MTRVVGGFALGAIVFACSSGPAQGTEGGACYPNGTCNASLTCLSNLCVNATTDSGANDAAIVDSGQKDTSTQDAPSDVVTSDASDAPSFDPNQLSGLALWLRADKGVTSDNLGITTWADQSINHNDFTTGTGRCIHVSSGINSLPAVDCTAGGSVTGHATTIGTGAFTIELVADELADNAGPFNSQGANSFELLTNSTKMIGNVVLGLNVQAQVLGTKAVTGGSAHVIGFVRDANGNIALRTDGAMDGSSASNGAVDLGYLPSSTIGAARVAELVVVAGVLTTQQTADLEAYLKARYGL